MLACGSAQASFWTSSTVPATPDENDYGSVTLGLEFQSTTAGKVTAVRFYKGQYNTGTHTGQLWSSSGSLLGSVTFTNETATGWQQATFASPISISANTTYVIAYNAPKGNYADDESYKWSSLSASPLKISGSSPGVYSYGGTSAFPNQSWDSSNYYVDLVFTASGSSTTYSISGTVSGSSASISLSGASSATATTNSSGAYTFSNLANGTYLLSPSESGYSFSPATTTVNINGGNITGVNFTATKSTSHSVTLTWTASSSSNITGYKVYRSGTSGGSYSAIATVSTPTYVDSNVVAGDTYYYVTTAVNSSGLESAYSNQATAVVP